MASATATATMAAAGFGKRHSPPSSLQTPASGTFPSEMLSPMAGSPGFMKKEEALKTPITPPSAYLDFLKNFSPAIQSPTSAATSTRFSFNDKSFDRLPDTSAPKSITPPTSHPPLSRNGSHDSNASHATDQSAAASNTSSANDSSKPTSPRAAYPLTQFTRPTPRSARTPRRLHIPQSPFSPALASAQTAPSPYSSTPVSGAPWSASFSPRDYSPADITSQPSKVHVRHIVTRTVTYCRTPLEPAPKGKRRKISNEDDSSAPTSKASSVEPALPAIKRERIDKIDEDRASSVSVANSTVSDA